MEWLGGRARRRIVGEEVRVGPQQMQGFPGHSGRGEVFALNEKGS